ncbi:Eukaryotic initiation factor 4E family protein [Histomonas meleagridis]|uniref:Eukaryotic initiation factor 4E family protein n=1 Tax=Histomonas meleagridis TaxID=135588 RepID=UPI003559C967|nr:Eukaryotic initiation factor 4E family protein [Histomonas meleagridis]KAH0803060.1 Eukaryotic initiation factor 4E family protein [Histomonas meleagridis]
MIPINRNGQNAFHFFRGDARAMWEDADNINGGAFNILIPTGHGPTMWEKLLLDLIGENLDYDIIGATISAKPNCFSLFIWNRTADLETARKLSDEIFKTLELPFQSTLRYSPHSRFLSSPGQEINTTTFKNGPDGSVMILEKKDPK